MTAPPLAELEDLAERAVGLLSAVGQATVLWRRGAGISVAFTAVAGGRAARVEADGATAAALARAAKTAGLRAAQARAWPSAGLPEHGPRAFGRTVETLEDPAARIAIASTHGIRASEALADAWHFPPQKCQALFGQKCLALSGQKGQALSGRKGQAALADRLRDGAGVVLGPVAVAAVLDRLRSAVGVDLALGHGPLAGRIGERIAPEWIDVRDDAGDPILGRRFDAEGVSRQPLAIVERGVFRGGVHDTASAARAGTASTGHATQPATLAPMPDHLVLAAGDADGVDALADAGPVAYLPDLPGDVEVDPLALLASVDALTASRAVVPLRSHCPGGTGVAVVPALRARAGIALRA